MKIINSALFRAFVAIVVGGLMIEFREQMVTWLTICIGILFFISGTISVITYYTTKTKADKALGGTEQEAGVEVLIVSKPTFPIVGLGSIILGVILFFMPSTFISYLVYIFAAILILGAIGQYVSLISTMNAIKDYKELLKSSGITTVDTTMIPKCGYLFWVIPTLLIIFGIYAIFHPLSVVSAPFLFIGIAMMIYGISEIINTIKFNSIHKVISKESPKSAE